MSAPDAAGPDDATRFTAAPDATRFSDGPAAEPDATRFSAAVPPATAPTPTPSAPAAASNRRLPRPFADYVLLEEIARGGMGVVYKARQQVGEGARLVALKLIQTGQLASAETVERFQREARAAAALDHPGIVPIYDIGEVDGQHYFTMQLLEGGSLAERAREGPLPPPLAVQLMRRVAEAVQHAHEHDVIHRDLKPANILLTGARRSSSGSSSPGIGNSGKETCRAPSSEVTPKVTDFGVARTCESGLSLTGEALGTPAYMPPEQARGQVARIGPAADVYGLGAVLYCLLTGRPPFQSSDPVETMRQVCDEEPVLVRQLNAVVPGDLETICLKCLEKEPARRYPSAAALAEELGRFERGEPILARPVGRLERSWRWCRRNPTTAGLLAGIALLLLTVAAVSVVLGQIAWREAREAEQARQHEADKAEAERQARQRAETSEKAERVARQRVQEQREVANLMAQTHETLMNIDAVLSTLDFAESSVRAFVVVGKAIFLASYQRAVSSLNRALENLLRLTKGNRAHQDRLRALKPLIDKRLVVLKTIIEARKRGATEEGTSARKLIEEDRGKGFMDEIRELLGGMRSEALLRLNELRTRVDQQEN